MVVDREFKDFAGVPGDLVIQVEMPSFLQKGQIQYSTEAANSSRLITKASMLELSLNIEFGHFKIDIHTCIVICAGF